MNGVIMRLILILIEIKLSILQLNGTPTNKLMGEEFSIVIPCKNESLYIEKLLLSIVGQSVYSPEVPIIVADDQSTDGTLDIINKCKQEHAMNLKVVAGGYPAIARNNGAQIASGKYLIFLDADVELGEINFLEKVLSLAREQNLFCVSSYIQCPDGNHFPPECSCYLSENIFFHKGVLMKTLCSEKILS